MEDFNPRSPCGERQLRRLPPADHRQISIHAPRAESDPEPNTGYLSNETFQSTLPVRRATAKMHKTVMHFCKGLPISKDTCVKFHLHTMQSSTIRSIFPASNGCEPAGKSMCAWGSRLDNQGIFWSISGLAAKVFDLLLVLLAEVIKPQAIPLRIHDGTKLRLQHSALSRVQQTLKYRILHPLAVVDAFLCNPAQPLSSGSIFCVYIISNEYQHCITSIKMVGKRPNRHGDDAPTVAPEHKESCPIPAFRPETDGSGFHAFSPANPLKSFGVHHLSA